MTAAEPLRPDLVPELIAPATQSAARRAQHVRNQLDAVQLGQDRHADHADTKVLRRSWPNMTGQATASSAPKRHATHEASLALHADNEGDFQRAATTLLERAVQDGDGRIQHWAHGYGLNCVRCARRAPWNSEGPPSGCHRSPLP